MARPKISAITIGPSRQRMDRGSTSRYLRRRRIVPWHDDVTFSRRCVPPLHFTGKLVKDNILSLLDSQPFRAPDEKSPSHSSPFPPLPPRSYLSNIRYQSLPDTVSFSGHDALSMSTCTRDTSRGSVPLSFYLFYGISLPLSFYIYIYLSHFHFLSVLLAFFATLYLSFALLRSVYLFCVASINATFCTRKFLFTADQYQGRITRSMNAI